MIVNDQYAEELTNGLTIAERREMAVTIKQNAHFTSVLRCDTYHFIGVFKKLSCSSTPVVRCENWHIILTSTVFLNYATLIYYLYFSVN